VAAAPKTPDERSLAVASGACAAAVDACLDEFLVALELTPSLAESIRYALFSGGKRVRPLLAWLCCEAMGADPACSLPAGASVEMVHAFSLVHDDLPAIDNDDLRRGRSSLHVRAGEASAILAGDALLTLAFRLLADRVEDVSLGSALVRELAGATSAMIVGQVLDIEGADEGEANAQRLARIHENKTGALITASCRMGAMCAVHALDRDAGDDLECVTVFGRAVGLIFQIVDDLIDVEQSSDHTGKSSGADAAASKLTYPRVHGVAASRREIARLKAEAIGSVERFGPGAARLIECVEMLTTRTR
jgi:geranylgeranyl diphosphate synthase type II